MDNFFLLGESLCHSPIRIVPLNPIEGLVVGEDFSQALLLCLGNDAILLCHSGQREAGHLHASIDLKDERGDEAGDASVLNGSTCEEGSTAFIHLGSIDD